MQEIFNKKKLWPKSEFLWFNSTRKKLSNQMYDRL